EVGAVVAEVIARVRVEGHAADLDYTRGFDRLDPTENGLRITAEETAAVYEVVDRPTLEALKIARERIEAHHSRQLPSDLRYRDDAGVELGWRWTAIHTVGIYVPGGLASYPSSVLMNAIPARV